MNNRYFRLRDIAVAINLAGAILIVSPQVNSSFALPKLAILLVGAPLALAFALMGATRSDFSGLKAGTGLLGSPWPAIAIVLMSSSISTFASISWRISLLGQYNRYGGLVGLIALTMHFAAIAIGGTRQTAKSVLFALAIATSIAAAYGTLQYFGIDPIPWQPTDGTPVFSTAGNSSFLAATTGIGLVATSCAVFFTRVSLRPLWLLSGLAFTIAVVGTKSLGFLLAAGAGVAFMIWTARRYLVRWSVRAMSTGLCIIAILAVTGIVAPSLPGPAGAIGRSFRESMEPRSEYWKAGIGALGDRPFFGWGLDTFAQVFPRHRSADHARKGGRLTDEVHNVPLKRFTETGMIAGIGWILLILQGLLASTKPPDDRDATLLLASGTGVLAAYSAQSLVSIDILGLAVIMWSSLGMIECVRGRDQEHQAPRLPQTYSRRIANVLAGILTLTSILGAIVSYRLLGADSAFAQGVRTNGSLNDHRHAYQRAIELNPWEARYRAALGSALVEASAMTFELRDEAIEAHLMAASLEPGNPYHAIRAGELFETLANSQASNDRGSDLRASRDWYQRALTLNPNDPFLERAICRVNQELSESGNLCGGSP